MSEDAGWRSEGLTYGDSMSEDAGWRSEGLTYGDSMSEDVGRVARASRMEIAMNKNIISEKNNCDESRLARVACDDMKNNYDESGLICAACEYLASKGFGKPEVGIVLGSGLGGYVERLTKGETESDGSDGRLTNVVKIPYREIPGFVSSTAPTHEGALYYGERDGRGLVIMSGRMHYYEGWEMREIIFPIRVMAKLGVKRLILTNAAGAINLDYKPGSIMMISDHINLSGMNPLIGANNLEYGVRFPDMTHAYPGEVRAKVIAEARARGIELHEGVYAMMSGPSYETPAEIRFLRTIGADAVGMSTVPEAIAANHAGLEVIGISCLSNAAAGITDGPLTSEEVEEAMKAIEATIGEVVDIAIEA